MTVPFIDLKRLVAKYRNEIDSALNAAVDQTAFVGGSPVQEFEASLADKLQVKHAIGLSNGTDALVVALQAVGVKAGMKVAVPNLTFWATVEAVVVLGAEPVFVDCDDSLQMSFDGLQKAQKTFGIDAAIVAHLYGWASPDLRAMRDFCRGHNIPLIEDAAQAYGVRFKDTNDTIFKDALISTLSFYPAKVIGACGDAGAVSTNSDTLAQEVRTLINHGRSEHYSYSHIGWNSRMSGLCAAYLNVMLKHDADILASRRKAEQFYLDKLSGHGAFKVVQPPAMYITNGYLNVCLVKADKIAALSARLKDQGIGFGRTYPETMEQQPAIKRAKIAGTLNHSRKVCETVLNLPLYAFMTEAELNKVVAVLD